jgi:cyclohexyl-isocyanide hydratase
VAGLLKGRRATTHWAYTGLLPVVGATYENGRVVRDGNVLTGGGVTAGIDFALTVAAELAGAEAAQRTQLSIEYDPAPPFAAGHPDRAPAPVREAVADRYKSRLATFRSELEQALERR